MKGNTVTTEYVHIDDVYEILTELKETELEYYKTQCLYWKGLYEVLARTILENNNG